ncbi:valine--tRNA ligase, mitochondrial [Drosophila subpulchrella]|uniref:valine--tRNA ligase, mitochondrial n=1 Tax=Drosophila subpulchrella TaxID=1486046 RepID=UPI0018A12A45|nr:valine--tRNA ligase, mitochondrial [Drosophila subpulchrella]
MQIIRNCSSKLLKHKYLCQPKVYSLYYSTLKDAAKELPLATGYQPRPVEQAYWEREQRQANLPKPSEGGCKRGSYRMLLPPPNVTGNLHLGHALMATVQDVIARQRQQLGYEVDWVPGTDHAGIATQVVVERTLASSQGKTRQEMGRPAFLDEVWRWKAEKGAGIVQDLRQLGCRLNWQREYFTMDEQQAHAVNVAFERLFDEGLISRRNSLLNWSTALRSAISDIEVDVIDIKEPMEIAVPGYERNVLFGRIYDFAYRVVDGETLPDGSVEEIVVSTTRPETILGDVAVAVHPLDPRYSKYRHLEEVKLKHPFRDDTIPLVFDISVDQEFGTGAVKITPAHDKFDFELANRHKLEPRQVFDETGHVLETYDEFKGKPRFEARELIVNRLEDLDLLRQVRSHSMQLPVCSRSKDVIEYMILPQWFLKCKDLARDALSELHSGRLQIQPPSFETEWERWLKDSRDWCISRQLWWGHQVPAYEVTDAKGNTQWVAAVNEKAAKQKAKELVGSKEFTLKRDPDVLDTWFSSSLLPFSTAGWPKESYKERYPLDLMQTGHDILFFWVARMMMMGLKLTGEAPFQRILLNGIVCDAHGRKMSKSLGNIVAPQQVVQGASLESLKAVLEQSCEAGIIKPEELKTSSAGMTKMFPNGIQECGTDALRFTLMSHNIKSHFISFDVNACYTNKLFLNKIWQAMRFTLGSAKSLGISLDHFETLEGVTLGVWDRWIIGRLAETLSTCSQSYTTYNFHLATAALKNFFYQNLCDIYLETTKAAIANRTGDAYIHVGTLAACLSWGLQAMAPFTPFVASELLQHVPMNIELKLSDYQDSKLEEEVNEIVSICQSVRQVKSRNEISKRHQPRLSLFAQNTESAGVLRRHLSEIQVLTRCEGVELELLDESAKISKQLSFFSTAGALCSFGLKVGDALALTEEKRDEMQLANTKKLKKLVNELQRYRMRLDNEAFQLMADKAVKTHFENKVKELEAEINSLTRLAA